MLWWPVIITRYNSSTQIICIDMYRDRARVKVMVRVNVQGKRELWETGMQPYSLSYPKKY